MLALTNSFCAVLLMLLVTRIALLDWRQRRGRTVPSLWWQPLARAVTGAALFFALTLWHLVIRGSVGRGAVWVLSHLMVSTKNGHLRWDRWIPIDQLGWDYDAGVAVDTIVQWIGFLVCYTGVVTFLITRWRRDWLPSGDGKEPERRLAGFQLLAGLAVVLWLPWFAVYDLGPDVLDALGFRGWIGYTGVSCVVRPRLAVTVEALDLYAGVTLLLWLFQHLWGRAMKGDSGHRSSPTPPGMRSDPSTFNAQQRPLA